MTRADTTPASHALLWSVVILVLLAFRLPSLVEPAGADQSLYAYVGQQINEGGAAYRDAWDQKPPAIHFIYAALWRAWPKDAVVAAADLVASGIVAWLLVVLGRQTLGADIGSAAATLFLLLGNPAIQRLSGVRVRAQCETFIAVAITAALVCLCSRGQRTWKTILAGACFAVAFWLKYNAAAYALPLAAVIWWRTHRESETPANSFGRTVVFLACGAAAVSAVFLAFFAAHGALSDLYLATFAYNVQYSGETYHGIRGGLAYLLFPLQRARVDLLWYIGGVGLAITVLTRRTAMTWICVAWLGAACLSILINGARDLPQYFVQAHPALAFAAAAGIACAWRSGTRPLLRVTIACLLMAGLWKVGDEPAPMRLGGVPEAVRNTAFDLAYARGLVDRRDYLSRFQQQSDAKYVPLSSDQLIERVRATTAAEDRILVFGLAANVYVDAPRRSASRFFWSRPVVVEFGRGRPGYGSAGLLQDLERTRPALVALQKHWDDTPPRDFFMNTPSLRAWLERDYVLVDDAGEFAVWQRRS